MSELNLSIILDNFELYLLQFRDLLTNFYKNQRSVLIALGILILIIFFILLLTLQKIVPLQQIFLNALPNK